MIDFRKEVYNKEIKERFLNSIDLSQCPPRWYERVFEKTYMFEKAKDKDLYSFTTPEILEFYKFLDVGTITPLIVYNTNLLKYAQWALNEHLVFDGMNHFDEINVEILKECLNVVKTQQSILSYDKFMILINQKLLNDQDKYIFYCLFEGIKGKQYQELINLKMSDIDEEKCMAHLCTGRDIYVDPHFIEICKMADVQTEYINLVDSDEGPVIRKLIPSDTILKEKHNSRGRQISRRVYMTLVRNANYVYDLSTVISGKSIRDSGLIYYLNKRAEKLGVSVEELLYNLNNCQDIIDKYQLNPAARKRWILQYEDYLR